MGLLGGENPLAFFSKKTHRISRAMRAAASAARRAVAACPHIVELLHGLLDNLWVIGQDARLEVALIAALHVDARPREVGAADIDLLAVKDQHLEVHPGTQHPLPTPRS